MCAWRVVAVFMVWPILAAPAFAQSAPTGSPAPTWGATPEAVVRAYPDAQCFGERTERSDWKCILMDTTVDAISVDVVLYGYSTGTALGMVGVVLSFDSAEVHRVVETLVARYGHWSRMVERDFVTKADKRFPSAIWLWHLPRMEIRVEQDRGTLGHGQAIVMCDEGLYEFLARERTWQKRGGDNAQEE